MKTKKYTFQDIVMGDEGLLKGPFGSDLKKSLYVPKEKYTYKVYLQENILKRDITKGGHYISKEYFNQKMKRYEVSDGDFIVTCDGTLGEIFQLKGIKEKGIISSSLLRITLNQELVDELFFPYFWLSRIKYPLIRSHDNSTLKHLPGVRAIREFEINLPDKTEQSKIAKVLFDLDAKIELNNSISQELEARVKTLYDYWFVQFDFPIPSTDSEQAGKPYKSSGGKMAYKVELNKEIPEGWNVKELNECVELIIDNRGKTPKKLGGEWSIDKDAIIALSAKIVKGGKLANLNQANKVSRELYDKWMSTKLIDGDILMTSEAPAGEFYFILKFTEYCLSQRLFAIRANKSLIIPSYFYYELSKGHGFSQIQGGLSGSTVFGIRQDNLRTIKVLIPNLDLQKKFDKIVIPQLTQIKQLDFQNHQLQALRDWLLPMLMNGQVKVGDV